MATNKSRKLKKADKALNAAAKLLAKAEKKRDSVLAREKAKLDKKLDKRADRKAKASKSAKPEKKTASAAKPTPAATKPAAAKPAAKSAPFKPAAAKPAPATPAPAAAKPAFSASNTVAELREAAKANGVSGYSSKTKAQLLDALS